MSESTRSGALSLEVSESRLGAAHDGYGQRSVTQSVGQGGPDRHVVDDDQNSQADGG